MTIISAISCGNNIVKPPPEKIWYCIISCFDNTRGEVVRKSCISTKIMNHFKLDISYCPPDWQRIYRRLYKQSDKEWIRNHDGDKRRPQKLPPCFVYGYLADR